MNEEKLYYSWLKQKEKESSHFIFKNHSSCVVTNQNAFTFYYLNGLFFEEQDFYFCPREFVFIDEFRNTPDINGKVVIVADLIEYNISGARRWTIEYRQEPEDIFEPFQGVHCYFDYIRTTEGIGISWGEKDEREVELKLVNFLGLFNITVDYFRMSFITPALKNTFDSFYNFTDQKNLTMRVEMYISFNR